MNTLLMPYLLDALHETNVRLHSRRIALYVTEPDWPDSCFDLQIMFSYSNTSLDLQIDVRLSDSASQFSLETGAS